MKIVVVSTLIFLLLLHLTLHRMAFFFSLSLSLSQHDHALLVSQFVNMIKSSNLVIFFAISVIVMAIFFLGSSKPSCGDFTSGSSLPPLVLYDIHQVVEYQEIEKAKDEDCDDFVPRLVFIEYKNNDFASCFSLPPLVGETTAKDDDDNNKKDDFASWLSLPPLAYEVEYEEEKAKTKDWDDIDNNDDFVPRLVYIEYKGGNIYEGYHSGYSGYDGDDNKNEGSDNDATSEDEEDDDDLDSRIEEFMAKTRKKWREELLDDRYMLRLPAAS